LTGAITVIVNRHRHTYIESVTAIKATFPAGGSTGPVQVVTPGGTLTSNVNFRVKL
jgi:hypothetical protein